MKLFDIFKKQKDEKNASHGKGRDNIIAEIVVAPEFKCDIVEWHYKRAEHIYRIQENKVEDVELEESDIEAIWEYAGNHISYFLTWLIKNDYYNLDAYVGSHEVDEVVEAMKKVKKKKLTGYEFLSEYCNKKFYKKDVVVEIHDFVDSYYNEKFKVDYKSFVQMVLGKEVNGLGFSWDEYENFSGLLDIAFANHQLSNK